MIRYRLKLLLITSATFLLSAQVTREYQIKAAFIFNFTQFVEWPAHSFSASQAPAVIGILGQDPFGSYLEEIIAGESLKQHPLVIQHYNDIDEIKDCHVLFINISDKAKLESALAKLKGKNILTISETNGFTKLGGMIRLYTRDNKINMQVNIDAVKAENLTISSKLLKLAEIVKGH